MLNSKYTNYKKKNVGYKLVITAQRNVKHPGLTVGTREEELFIRLKKSGESNGRNARKYQRCH